MPKNSSEDTSSFRHFLSGFRNAVRYNAALRPSQQKQRIGKLSTRGLHPKLRSGLKQKRTQWVSWVRHAGAGNPGNVRVGTKKRLSQRPSAYKSFVGTGLDENVATRLLKQRNLWTGISVRRAKDIFNTRSRTADLVWHNPAAPNAEPIAGHTPSIKSQAVGGTTGQITQGHGNGKNYSGRDGSREHAVDTTLNDLGSPKRFFDIAVMSSLATIKYMSDPSTRLNLAKPQVAASTVPRYAALTGNRDLRQPAVFDELVAHVQEERERKKWETGSIMQGDARLSPMVPPVMRSYLETHGNDPHKAMETFRYDLHRSWLPAPPVNTSVDSDTRDLTKHSLNTLATKTSTTGRRQRSLSDARWLPPTTPANSRDY